MEKFNEITLYITNNPYIFFTLLAWSLIWKGIALWKSARLYHKNWFIALLIINSIGILDIIYIFVIARKAEKELPPSEI